MAGRTARIAAMLALLSAATVDLASAQTAAAVPPACSPASADISVSTAAHLAALVQATNCSQGKFAVSWEGALVFSEPIVVGNSTTVSVTGVGEGAALDGGGVSRLFQVWCVCTPRACVWCVFVVLFCWQASAALS